jgi:acetyl-CoA carboxylase carboxyl transferase subunit beta
MPENLWVKDPETGQMIYYKDLEANQFVVPGSNYHWRMSAGARLKFLFDGGQYDTIALPEVPLDPLRFRDERRYTDRLKDAKSKTGLTDAVLAGAGRLDGEPIVAAVQDFDFLGGSLGTAAGEAVIAAMRAAVQRRTPFILFAASGGARMQEGILSLMQMPRTTVAVQELREAGLPYIVVLTHPTTGGVTASYAMLGDIQIAEPGALIGFAGPRVIEQTIREQLPNGFQRAEYLYDHGMVDMVVHRHELRATLARLCHLLTHTHLKRDIGLIEQVDGVAHHAGNSGNSGNSVNSGNSGNHLDAKGPDMLTDQRGHDTLTEGAHGGVNPHPPHGA